MISLCWFFLRQKIIFGSGNFSGMIIGSNAMPGNDIRAIYTSKNPILVTFSKKDMISEHAQNHEFSKMLPILDF